MKLEHCPGVLPAVLLAFGQLTAGFQFEFACRGDTVQRVNPGGIAEFDFTLMNTGTEPDIYEFACRVVQPVSGWSVIYCLHGQCNEPGGLMYDTLNAGETDTAITVTVFTSSTHGEEVVSLRVRSLGAPLLAESVATRTVVSAGVEESRQRADSRARPVASLARGGLLITIPGDLFDSQGRRVAVMPAGSSRVGLLAPGVYVFRARDGDRSAAWKVVLQ